MTWLLQSSQPEGRAAPASITKTARRGAGKETPSAALLVGHLVIVSSPLVLVGNVAWIHPLVPTLEGQYIIKDLALLALTMGIIATRELAALRAAPVMASPRDRVQS